MRTERYGAHAGQHGDLHLPARPRPPVVCLLHGGFWRMPYGREQLDPIAQDLVARGFAVWNLGYRRLGEAGGGWPGSCDDAAAGIAHLTELVAGGIDLDLDRVTVVGHSAGGHLALWAAATLRAGVRIAAAVGLAPVADLVRAHELGLGNGAVAALLGGSPAEQPERYRQASPLLMLPIGVEQVILHGTADSAVPIELSRGYAHAARAAGDAIELVELRGGGHMEFLDPASAAHAALCAQLARR